MKKFSIIKVLLWTIVIAASYAAFQHFFFDMSLFPFLISIIETVIFIRIMGTSKQKMKIFGLLIGITMYVTFIAVGYGLFRIKINHYAPVSSTINYSAEKFTDILIYSETGHKGIVGYMSLRTHTRTIYIGGDSIENSHGSGIMEEIFKFLLLTFMPLLSQLDSINIKGPRK